MFDFINYDEPAQNGNTVREVVLDLNDPAQIASVHRSLDIELTIAEIIGDEATFAEISFAHDYVVQIEQQVRKFAEYVQAHAQAHSEQNARFDLAKRNVEGVLSGEMSLGKFMRENPVDTAKTTSRLGDFIKKNPPEPEQALARAALAKRTDEGRKSSVAGLGTFWSNQLKKTVDSSVSTADVEPVTPRLK